MDTLWKNVLIVYNPNAGKGKAKRYADELQEQLTKLGNVALFCASSVEVMRAFYVLNENNPKQYTMSIIIGGDGTLGLNVDAMIKNNFLVPVFAFGKGTANDFSSYLKTNVSVKKACKMIEAANLVAANTLSVNGKDYAVNVAGGGAFTNGVTTYNKESKRQLGRLAYLSKAFFKAFTLKSQVVRFTVDEANFETNIFLFYILNSKHVGGLKGAGNKALVDDGMFDLVCIKRCGFWGKFCILISLLTQRLDKNKRVIYVQGKQFKAEPVGKVIHNFTKTDIDGNAGDEYPLQVGIGPSVKFFRK